MLGNSRSKVSNMSSASSKRWSLRSAIAALLVAERVGKSSREARNSASAAAQASSWRRVRPFLKWFLASSFCASVG
jgi:hypothetical protein